MLLKSRFNINWQEVFQMIRYARNFNLLLIKNLMNGWKRHKVLQSLYFCGKCTHVWEPLEDASASVTKGSRCRRDNPLLRLHLPHRHPCSRKFDSRRTVRRKLSFYHHLYAFYSLKRKGTAQALKVKRDQSFQAGNTQKMHLKMTKVIWQGSFILHVHVSQLE